jgi:hypothetical protein
VVFGWHSSNNIVWVVMWMCVAVLGVVFGFASLCYFSVGFGCFDGEIRLMSKRKKGR